MNRDNRRIKRVFLVGCPRSGTTLLQSMLAAHPGVYSLPETHFFATLQPKRRLARLARLASRRAAVSVAELEVELGTPLGAQACAASTLRGATHRFCSLLDAAAARAGADCWVEKTPRHLHHIEAIARLVPRAQFVHLLRAGEDVVASLVDVTHRFPAVWGGARDYSACVARWKADIEISRAYHGVPGHTLVRYEALVDDPRRVLQLLCQRLGIPFAHEMVTEYTKSAAAIGATAEPWKARVQDAIAVPESRKFHERFDLDTRSRIMAEIEAIVFPKLDCDHESLPPFQPAGTI